MRCLKPGTGSRSDTVAKERSQKTAVVGVAIVALVGAALYGQSVWRRSESLREEGAHLALQADVMVEGAVKTPRLLRITAPVTIRELVEQCGGYLPSADLAAFDENQVISTPTDVWIPFVEPTEERPISLNEAPPGQLALVPGIGDALAAKIVEYRERVGPFRDVEQLLEVEGIGDTRLAQARPFLKP